MIYDHAQLCTQFEDKFARKFLPCFDEPIFKAVFQMTVSNVQKGHIAISNTIPEVNYDEETET